MFALSAVKTGSCLTDEKIFLVVNISHPAVSENGHPLSSLSVLAEGGYFMLKNKDLFGILNLSKLKVTVMMAILAAVSIVFGKFLALPIGEILRFSFENTPLLLSGILFGSIPGAITGIVADLLGCLLRGYSINIIITLGAAVIGFIGGIFAYKSKNILNILLSVLFAHILGSVIIKTVGLSIVLNYPFWITLFQRSLNYVIVAISDAVILICLFKNKSFIKQTKTFLR